MNDQKQLIKAINDLTKALNKNTEAIKENKELSKLDMNTVESGTPDDLKIFLDSQKAYQSENKLLCTDGLGNSYAYRKGYGGIIQGGKLPEGFKPWDGVISTGEVTLTKEDKEVLIGKLLRPMVKNHLDELE